MVFDKYVSDIDEVAYIEFNHQIYTRIKMRPKEPSMRQIFENAYQTGGTNMWDAMLAGIEQFKRVDPEKKRYIIALTDGDNGRSNATLEEVCEAFRRHHE